MISGQKVDVYWNLHRNCFSVRARTGKRQVIAHTQSIVMANVELIVSDAGRSRVIQTKRKNVHAVLRGEWIDAGQVERDLPRVGVTYNPYLHSSFVVRNTNAPVHFASVVLGRIVDGKARLEAIA